MKVKGRIKGMPTEFRLYDVKDEDLYKNRSIEEKEKILFEMVQYAKKRGFKPAARKYNTYPSTVRRWAKKYDEGGIEALKFKRKKQNNCFYEDRY